MSADLPAWEHDEYIETTWGELVELQYGKGLKGYKGAVGEFPVYGTNGPIGFCDKSLCDFPSVIIGRKGAYRGVHYSGKPFYVIDTAYFVVPKYDINLKWAYYSLLTQDINGLDSGSAIPSTRREDFYAMPANVPPRIEQDRIVENLDCFNSKIELNRQTNQTLEQIAQAIFKSWFVDFEPVKAKIKAKQEWARSMTAKDGGNDEIAGANFVELAAMCAISGKTEESLKELDDAALQQFKTTAALFPDDLIESELGEIPKGWGAGTLDDLCNLNKSSWTKKNAPEDVWYVDLASTKNGVIEEVQYYLWDEAPSRARRILNKGDTIVGTVRPGNRSYALTLDVENQLTSSTGFAVLSPKKTDYLEFVYIATTSDENIDRLTHLADGGAYPAVRPDVVTQLEIAIPPESVISGFSKLVKPLFEKINCNLTSKKALEGTRNALLPKLLSGDIELTASQIAAEAVA